MITAPHGRDQLDVVRGTTIGGQSDGDGTFLRRYGGSLDGVKETVDGERPVNGSPPVERPVIESNGYSRNV